MNPLSSFSKFFEDKKQPTPKIVISKNQVATVLVNKKMPDILNLSLRDAIAKLQNFEIILNYSGAGQVTGQSPVPGTKMKKGMTCTLTLGQSS